MPLDDLRTARDLTQAQLARVLNVSQGAVSKVERRADVYISTLRSYITAMGGRPRDSRGLPRGRRTLNQFEDLKAPAETEAQASA